MDKPLVRPSIDSVMGPEFHPEHMGKGMPAPAFPPPGPALAPAGGAGPTAPPFVPSLGFGPMGGIMDMGKGMAPEQAWQGHVMGGKGMAPAEQAWQGHGYDMGKGMPPQSKPGNKDMAMIWATCHRVDGRVVWVA